MKKFLIIYSVVATLLLAGGVRILRNENKRLKNNQTALAQEVEHYKSALGDEVASAQILRLRCGEYEDLRKADAERIRSLGIRIRRLESAARSVAATEVEAHARIRDTVVVRDTVRLFDTLPRADTLRRFRWSDPWVEVEGEIDGGDVRCTVRCTVRCIDTLHQVVHRVPRRFLFIRYGTKAIRQDVFSTNPHTVFFFSEYVKIECLKIFPKIPGCPFGWAFFFV